ncbi:uncharacterized protein LOC116617811 [Nematostella vectensis]|uniref:uncharacterized protein LOC116617811 n=1 Tax=Nematostella vectensis TaxID=45351 RepID=UPI0020776B96|nr:uncharacterized protein LOC116617811 [Nematostella vectensis]XP_048585481.1 uncharacterized protein LOC116617811 [Nematostella vectensis]
MADTINETIEEISEPNGTHTPSGRFINKEPFNLDKAARDLIINPAEQRGYISIEPKPSKPEVGLAFSGGGIRSAALCSGALRQILGENPTLENVNLSCVSGGGYTGSAFLEWYADHVSLKPEDSDQSVEWQKEFFENMHKNAGYMCNFEESCITGLGHLLLFVMIILLVNIVLSSAVWFPYAVPLAYAIDFVFGSILREKLTCPSPISTYNYTNSEEIPVLGLEAYSRCKPPISRVLLFTLTVFFSLLFYLFSRLNSIFPHRITKSMCFTYKGIWRLASVICGLIFLLTAIPWFMESSMQRAPLWIKLVVILACLILPFFLPIIRNYAGLFLLFLVYSEIVAWRVYKNAAFGIVVYSDQVFFWVLFASAVLILLSPLAGAMQQSAVNLHNRRQLTSAFYKNPSGCMPQDLFPCCTKRMHEMKKAWKWVPYEQDSFMLIRGKYKKKPRPDGQLFMDDIKDLHPKYISNITVNQWRVNDDDPNQPDYQLLAFSPTGVELVSAELNNEEPSVNLFKNYLQPDRVRLADAMALSAAALGTSMGSYNAQMDSVLDLFNVLGVGIGDDVVCDSCDPNKESLYYKCFLPCFIEVLLGVPLVGLSIPFFLGYGESWIALGVFVFFGILAILAGIAVSPPTQPLVRWCIIHIFIVRFLRGFMNVTTNGSIPPPILRLSDGGHFENLALLPLLKKRLKRIVVIDGSCISDEKKYGDDLLGALQLARDRLHCSFLDEDGNDVILAIKENLVMKKLRSFRFKVKYRNDPKEGEILFVVPRRPGSCQSEETGDLNEVRTEQPQPKGGTEEEKIHQNLDIPLTEEEVNRLTCCCCECCHSDKKCIQWFSEKICGTFPSHSTANAFFTKSLFRAYHREGFYACSKADAGKFLAQGQQIE